jgi:peroxiredoxin
VTRHVFPRLLATALCLIGVLAAGVRAQDGGGDEPKPAETEDGSDAKKTGDDAVEGGSENGGDADAAEPEPQPPAVGEAFPERLPARVLAKNPAADDNAPEGEDGVTLATLAGEKPRPVVLVFWSGRCSVCKRYAEVLRKLSSGFGDKVALVLVASGSEETAEAVREAQDAAELRLTTLLDTEREAAAVLGVRVTPTAFLIDAEGVLRYRGPIDDDRRARSRDARELLRPAVDAVLAGKDVENGDVRPFGSALR